jgi:pilus assembly protein CpaB
VAGQRVAGAIAAGGYVTAGALAVEDRSGPRGVPIRRGERSVDVAVAGGEALVSASPGTRVDVIVTTESRSGAGGGRTYLALQDVELLGARAGAGSASGDGEAAGASTTATLRVTLRQAVYLTGAQSFAREIRLLARSPGDRRTAPPLAVHAGGL